MTIKKSTVIDMVAIAIMILGLVIVVVGSCAFAEPLMPMVKIGWIIALGTGYASA